MDCYCNKHTVLKNEETGDHHKMHTQVTNVLWCRLRDLLQREEQALMEEVTSKQETPLERQARMRERVRSLREKRETERLALVEDKLEQRWR